VAFTERIDEYKWMTTGGFDRDYHRVRDGSTSEVGRTIRPEPTAAPKLSGRDLVDAEWMIEHIYGTAGIPLRGLLDAGGGDI
jgi:hypothetical protein